MSEHELDEKWLKDHLSGATELEICKFTEKVAQYCSEGHGEEGSRRMVLAQINEDRKQCHRLAA